VRDACGKLWRLRAAEAASALDYDPRRFRDPREFYYDWCVVRPYLSAGWLEGLAEYLARGQATAPRGWMNVSRASDPAPLTGAGGVHGASAARGQVEAPRDRIHIGRASESALFTVARGPRGASAAEFLAAERAEMRRVFEELAGRARAPRTVKGLRNAGLKLLWFLASRGAALPPSAGEFTDYLVYLSVDRGASGAISAARGALLHMCRVNRWPTEPYTSGIALIPGMAAARRNRHQVKKSAGLRLAYVARILDVYCFERPGVPVARQWEFAVGVGIIVSYCVLARWDDARQLLWDDDYFEEAELYVRFFLEHRKNAQATGNFVDVARPSNPRHRGAFHVIKEARRLFRRGHVLPRIVAGFVDTAHFMSYSTYVRHLRHALVCVGVPRAAASSFAGQSARSGAATEAVYAGARPEDICRMAGVTSISWCLGYMRPDQVDRLEASRKIGL
jgi:hypothetical protein